MLCVLAALMLVLLRALRGPTLYDRLLAANTMGTITVLIIVLHGFSTDRPDFLDIALVYALMNFIGTLAVLKFFEYRDMARGSADEVVEPEL